MGRPVVFFGRSVTSALLVFAACVLAQWAGSLSSSLTGPAYADKISVPSRALIDAPELAALQAQFQSVADRVAPSVVAISVATAPVDAEQAIRAEELTVQRLRSILERTSRTVGTGFIIDPDGYIVTNEHVIGDADQLWVTTDDRQVYPAVVIGSDPRSDLAVLKIPATNLPTVSFGDYSAVKRGQWAIALGNPYGFSLEGEMCMSVGVVSATGRSLPKLASKENRLYSNLIQTTAEINPGNSGGPLFDLEGNVIGINTAVILPQKQTNGIGFAVPVTPRLLRTVHDLKQGREVVYAYLGVVVSSPTPRLCREAGIDNIGALIESVEADSPAAASDLRPSDIIVEINDETIRDCDHFVRAIGNASVEEPARIGVYRGGRPTTVEITLRKRTLPGVAITRENQRFRWRGMLLGPIPSHWSVAGFPRPEQGLMVLGIDSTSPFIKQGIAQGSVISRVAGKPLRDVVDLQQIINETPAELCAVECSNPTGALAATLDHQP